MVDYARVKFSKLFCMYQNADFICIVTNFFFPETALFSVMHAVLNSIVIFLFYSVNVSCTQLEHVPKYIIYGFPLWASHICTFLQVFQIYLVFDFHTLPYTSQY